MPPRQIPSLVVVRHRERLLNDLARQRRRFLFLAAEFSHAAARVMKAREGESWERYRARLASVRRTEVALAALTDEERVAEAGAATEAALAALRAAGAPLGDDDERAADMAPRAHDAVRGLVERARGLPEAAWRAELAAAPPLVRWCVQERREASGVPTTRLETVTRAQLEDVLAWARQNGDARNERDAQAAIDGSRSALKRIVKVIRLRESGHLT